MTDALVTLNQTLFGQYVANVVAFTNVSEDPTWLQAFADAIRDSANGYWDNHMVTGWTLDNITVSFLDTTSVVYSVVVDFTAGDLQGNIITDGLPPQAAVLISTSHVGARPNRGRTYFSGIAEAGASNGEAASASVADLAQMVRDWADGLDTLDPEPSMVILRRKSDKYPANVTNSIDLVKGNVRLKTQRRRALPDE